MTSARVPPHLTLRRRVYFARVTVPVDVRTVIGRNIFIASTGERDPHRAYLKAVPMIAEWKARIETARRHRTDPIEAEVQRLAALYRQKADPEARASVYVEQVLRFAFEHVGGLSGAERRAALAHASTVAAIQALPAPVRDKVDA